MVKYRIFPAVVAALALDPVSCLATDFVGAVAVQGDYAYVGINRSVVVVDVSDPRHPAPVGQTSFWPDNRHWFVEDVNAISVAGDHAYVVYDVGAYSGRKHSMVVIDVSCPTEPRVVASYDCFSGRASGVTVSGHQAYLYHSIGLDVVDISTPTEPARVGRWTTHDSPSRIVRHPGPFVAIAGNHAYVADQKGGLRVLDVSDPTAPEEVGSCPSAYCENVAVFGNLAFVTSGLEIIDIGDPENPKVIDTYHNRRLLASRPARMGVFAVGNYVFFYGCDRAVWREPIPPSDPLPVVDISDPSAPKKTFALKRPPVLDDAVTSVAVEGSHAYLGAGPRLVVVDVSAPEHLSVVGSTEVLPCKLTAVAVSGNHAFLAGGCGGLRVLDISDADSPKDVGSFRPPGEIVTVSVAGDYVFAGERDLVHMLDVCDPKASREVASCRIARPAPKAAIEAPGNLAPSLPPRAPEITVVNNYACLAVDGKMLQVLDISDPTTVKELYRYEDVPARQVAAYGNHVLAMFGGGLCVVDLSPLAWAARMPYLAALALVVSVALALIVLRVRRSLSRRLIQAEGGTEFAADLWTLRKRRKFLSRCLLGLVLLVVALPPALLMLVPKVPCVVGRYAPPGIAQGLAVAGHHAYLVGGGDDGQGSMLWTLDLSDPASPREVGSCELSEQWAGDLDVAVASDYAYVVDDSHSLTVVNVADATVPVLAGSHRESIHSTNPQAIAAAGRHVLVADGHWGMRVFDVKDPASPTPVCHYDSPLGP